MLSAAVVAVAPLAAGGVHRAPMIVLFLACAAGLMAFAVGGAIDDRPLRVSSAAALPFVFLVVPALQCLPLPLALRGLLDPAGNGLLVDNDLTAVSSWPLSLDPPQTREHVGRAAAALAAFLVASHLAASKTRRKLLPRLVALTGVAAVFIGLGHRLFGIRTIYGLFQSNIRSLLTGPFVNSNHTAEFLELAAFAALASSFYRKDALNRFGWLGAMFVCAVGAIATLSRGSLVGVTAGALVFAVLRYRMRGSDDDSGRRYTAAGGVLMLGLSLGAAVLLGAGAMIDRFRTTPLSQDLRFQVWRDSAHVLAAHPLGIGRGAFERVYPVYRTVKSQLPLTFAYVENHPLQLLIDSGWPLFLLLFVTLLWVGRQVVVRGRHDKIEAALLAGLFAVGAHSLVDFGLETLGVLLPFMAILGTLTGRQRDDAQVHSGRRLTWPLVAVACLGLLYGAASTAASSDDDFDLLLRRAQGSEQVRSVLRRAQSVHPTDYYYALTYARTEPLKPASPGRSPRLHALNRALRLCPGCDLVHLEVARSLWRLGSRSQALVEWRTAIELQPALLAGVMRELHALGATPRQLAAVAVFDARKMIDVADFLAGEDQVDAALEVLEQADAMNAPRNESLLMRAKLQIQAKRTTDAQATLAEAHAAGIRDPRLSLLDAQLLLEAKGQAGADEAMAILDLAATRDPLDLPIQRKRIWMVSTYQKWQAADRAIDGFKLALYHALGTSVDANLEAARIRSQLSQWTAAFGEYRIALAQAPNPSVWLEFGGVAERAGRDETAREAYSEVVRLSPTNPGAVDGLRRLDARRINLRRSAVERDAMTGTWHAP